MASKCIPGFVILILCCTAFSLLAQQSTINRELDSATKLAQNGNLQAADKIVKKIVRIHPESGPAWDLLAEIAEHRLSYDDSIAESFNALGKTLSLFQNNNDSDGKKQILNIATAIRQTNAPFYDQYEYYYVLRKAMMLADNALNCSVYARRLTATEDVDTNVNDKASKYFEEAEKKADENNADDAIALNKSAIKEYPDFYIAHIRLGQLYCGMGKQTEAIAYYQLAEKKYPLMLMAYKNAAYVYEMMGAYDKCLEECIASLTAYPDVYMLQNLETATEKLGKKIDIKWTARQALPNRILSEKDKETENKFGYKNKRDDSLSETWKYYKQAQAKVSAFCDADGIIVKPNAPTKSKYMEVYSWEEMLKNSNDASLDEARRMQKLGYLDCYVMVSCFHFDFYKQYLDFVVKNRERVIRYYRSMIKKR